MCASRLKRRLLPLLLIFLLGIVMTVPAVAEEPNEVVSIRDYAVGSSSFRAVISSSIGENDKVEWSTFTVSSMTGLSTTIDKFQFDNKVRGFLLTAYLYDEPVRMRPWPAKIVEQEWLSDTRCKVTWYSYSTGEELYSEILDISE